MENNPKLSSGWTWERLFQTDFFLEKSFIAKVYGEALRDNFVGYQPREGKADLMAAMQAEYLAEIAKPRPDLAQLLRIEAALTDILEDDAIMARFWTINDRFQRVVPLGTRATYQSSVPPRGGNEWGNPNFVRHQTRTLLDVIQANYTINMAREKSIKRLKIMLSLVASGYSLITIGVLLFVFPHNPLGFGLTLFAYLGVLGAILSLTNRLQTAVARDAMTEDGIFELTGLRMGWWGMMMSLFMGGAFAIILYFIVMAGAITVATPTPAPTSDSGTSSSASGTSDDTKALINELLLPQTSQGGSRQPEKDPCAANKPPCPITIKRLYQGLHLMDEVSLYKMLILAFLAGFAERLAPDILNRLSKVESRRS